MKTHNKTILFTFSILGVFNSFDLNDYDEIYIYGGRSFTIWST
ncbi:hypothetical protein [Aquimarina sp. MMG016]|nr:hypothetical protein [Aquimarina sp. MMG016]